MCDCQIGECSLFNFIDPPRHTALRSTDRVVGEQEADVLKIHLEQFLLLAVPTDATAQVSNPPPSGGSGGYLEETKKPTRIKVTVKKADTVGTTTSLVAASVSTTAEDVAVTSAPAMVSPRPVLKRQKIMLYLSTFQATKAAQALHAGSCTEAQAGSGSSMPLTSRDIVSSAAGGQSVPLADLISQASVVPVSSSMPPPLFTTSVIMTPSPVTTPLFSSSTPVSIFDSLIGDFPVSGKEMPTTSAGGESTSAKDTIVSDTKGSSGTFVEDGARLFDDLYLTTVCCDPKAQDKRHQSKWKIAESSRLVFPLVVHHWVERAYPPAESANVEGLDNEHLMNTTMVDAVSGPRRLAEI
ncbi:hypothetical protein HanPI659440_Chr04g0157681 [Helianthus annuus]|nr:hypothetical protein HanPI659440_Chr04g0157681 [Helianthus annuus]